MENEGTPTPSKPEDVGAGTGVSARDAGEEASPVMPESDEGVTSFTDEDAEWRAIGGGAMTEEGAAAGGLRDEAAPAGEGADADAD